MLTRVQIICFVASYAVALGLEIARLFYQAPLRTVVAWGFTAAGLLAHTFFLVARGAQEPLHSPPLSSWFDWLLIVAWGVVAVYLGASLRRSQAAWGIFVLPAVLLLIALAWLFRDTTPFPRDQALIVWALVHGLALLLGVITALLAFVAGLMYLVHSYRLKHKIPPREGLRLPTLEWLQRANRRLLVCSSCLLATGLISGVVLNAIKRQDGISWTDPVVWSSGILLVWLVGVLIFEMRYKPAQEGRKVAYLTVASFVFLGLVMATVLLVPSQHAAPGRVGGRTGNATGVEHGWSEDRGEEGSGR